MELHHKDTEKRPSLAYVAPFVAFLAFLGLRSYLPFGPDIEYPLRVLVVAAVLVVYSRRLLQLRPGNWMGSIGVGVLVFVVWIGPDLLWPGYRQHWLLSNAVTGAPQSSLPADVRVDWLFLFFRIAGTALLVPIIEEFFWRGWLMRYLISTDFERIRLGTYSALSFWATAVLFASEHGPYWDVGLAAGILYNWWMIRTSNLADCVLAHAVTNGCLALYIISAGQWQYWL